MSGFAPAIDAAGNVFVVTGNGDFTASPAKDWGESVLKLGPTLSFKSSFTPDQYGPLSWGDVDFGSGGVMLLPPVAGQKAPPMAVAMGKDAVLYLLKQTGLGGLSVNDANALDARRLAGSGGGLWGGPAYFNGPAGPTVYTQINGDVLRAFSVPVNLARPAFLTQALGTSKGGYGGSLPIVSSIGAAPHNGVVWVVRRSAPIELEAYDAGRLGQPIYSANIGDWSIRDNNNSFLTAIEANGRVYVATYLAVQVFGLTQ